MRSHDKADGFPNRNDYGSGTRAQVGSSLRFQATLWLRNGNRDGLTHSNKRRPKPTGAASVLRNPLPLYRTVMIAKAIAGCMGLLLFAAIVIGLWAFLRGANALAVFVGIVFIVGATFNVFGALRQKSDANSTAGQDGPLKT